MKPRKAAPTRATNPDTETHYYRVWAESPSYQEDPAPWKCLAVLYYLGDALDYIAWLQDRRIVCVFQSPTGCRTYKAGDARAVWKAAV